MFWLGNVLYSNCIISAFNAGTYGGYQESDALGITFWMFDVHMQGFLYILLPIPSLSNLVAQRFMHDYYMHNDQKILITTPKGY